MLLTKFNTLSNVNEILTIKMFDVFTVIQIGIMYPGCNESYRT